MDLHHPILREFPEHRETIKHLKSSSESFRTMFAEYHKLDEMVYRIEEEIEFATDQEFDDLRKRRAWLKDQIYYQIRHAPIRSEVPPFQARTEMSASLPASAEQV